jgi:hypothetical protein
MESWSKFRRGLRLEDQEALDDLFRAARLQLASSAYAARPIPFESIAMAMLLAQHTLIRRLEEQVRRLDRRLTGLETSDGSDSFPSPEGRTPQNDDSHRLAV